METSVPLSISQNHKGADFTLCVFTINIIYYNTLSVNYEILNNMQIC